jgi:predicted secreted protein
MTAILGRKVRIEQSTDGGSTWNTVAGARSDTLKVNRENADVTDKDDDGMRALLGDATLVSFDFGVEGVFKDDQMLQDALNPNTTLFDLRVNFEGMGTATGQFALSNFNAGAPHNGETTFTSDFLSSGSITWAAAT